MISRVANLHLVNVNVKSSATGHSYYHSSPAVSSDLILLLRDNRNPGSESGRPLLRGEKNFWQITDGYPFLNSPQQH